MPEIEICPLIVDGQPQAPTGDRYGAVWDSGLPTLCVSKCFRIGEMEAEANGRVLHENHVSEEEREQSEGASGIGEGIRAVSPNQRLGYIEIDGGDEWRLLSSSMFWFLCKVEN